jgi:hypothetical protein
MTPAAALLHVKFDREKEGKEGISCENLTMEAHTISGT